MFKRYVGILFFITVIIVCYVYYYYSKLPDKNQIYQNKIKHHQGNIHYSNIIDKGDNGDKGDKGDKGDNGVKGDNDIDNTKTEELINEYRSLYKLYHDGVEDTYDSEGNLMRGLSPDPSLCIHYLQLVISSPYGTLEDHYYMAQIYHHGFHTMQPDLARASEIYTFLKQVMANQTNDPLFQDVSEGLYQIHHQNVLKWLGRSRPMTSSSNEPLSMDQIESITLQRMPNRETIQVMNEGTLIETNNGSVLLETDQQNIIRYKNDSQNTHDTGILSTIRVAIDDLVKSVPVNNIDVFPEIYNYINSHAKNDIKRNAIKSLRHIERNGNDKLSSIGISEKEALKLVWERIKQQQYNDAMNILVNQLANMQNNDITVCSTGRLTRIIDTLNGIDEMVNIRPIYAINEEMMLKSAKIRDDYIKELSEDVQKRFEEGTNSDQEDDMVRSRIRDVLYKDYVDSGILTIDRFNSEVNKWINHV